jgi:hypothetical protein
VNNAEALAAARRVRLTGRRQSQIDNIAAELAAHLGWIQQNPDAVWNLLPRRRPPTPKGKPA